MKRNYLFVSVLILTLITNQLLGQTFKDPRDGQSYPVVEVGRTTWFARNLNYETEDSFCYLNQTENCEKFGRLYRWEAALSACPPGWHLSTEYDWQYLETALGMEFKELNFRANRGTDEGGKMKEGGTSGLAIRFAGYRRKNGVYKALGTNAALWTSTESDFAHAWHRDIDTGDDFSFRSRVVKSYALSCRCVKNNYTSDSPDN